MSEQLTGIGLDRAIAEALFINAIHSPFDDEWYLPNGDRLPRWSMDANATLAVCAERGWALIVDPDGAQIIVPSIYDGHESHYDYQRDASDESWQEAAARALLAALTATADR